LDFIFCLKCRYVLSRIESSSGVCKGSRIWHLSFGGGFKVNPTPRRKQRLIFSHMDHSTAHTVLLNLTSQLPLEAADEGLLLIVQVNTAVWKSRKNVKDSHPCWQ